ncbi:MAG: hypothetical protein UV73_C0005G0016 [Candidatus Gottesmanbacteria bacterium GW2011_GWA2_43_14]|uniref:Glycosyltransferase RgtA/B/C/D-like domain-containing protein n=1 Tax=Candidatus Gottesmanbacteria bacterium GW2011_GWA2_43_14 TaxID=1618443 RepID=A0A0G1DJ96_9BACT|nr:MAG: hypothetical protein UV73_C0005G0016 [Candidatus Gottesmanbacteria bacterium GW2011_GWA2_43_14]
MKKKIDITLVLILSIAFLLRFYKLNHDAPYFFNPDERNMASAVTRFVVPTDINRLFPCLYSEFLGRGIKTTQADCSLNPHFFAYGQFPLYLAFTSDILIKTPLSLLQGTPMMTLSTDFAAAVFWLRFWSAAASLGTVFLVYRLAIVLSLPAATSAILAAFLPGLIQSAHFGTTESLLTFFFTASLFLSIKLFNTLTSPARHFITLNKNASLLGLVTGIAAGSKLTGIFLLLPPYFALLTYSLQPLRKFRSGKWRTLKIQKLVKNIPPAAALAAFITTTTVLFFILSSPYNLIESRDFHSAVFGYEKDVAMGRYEAFYTRQFIDSQPFIFQINKVFPYSLGWPVFLLGTGGILLAFFKRKNFGFAVLLFSFFIYVIPNSLLFVKWTRFMTPVLPFFALLSALSLDRIKKYLPKLYILLLVLSFLPGIAFMSIYRRKDTRVAASEWIYGNIPAGSYVLSETANVIDIPLGMPQTMPANYQSTVISFDFYHLEERPELLSQLTAHLSRADYIFIPSRRIYKNFLPHPEKFPLASRYYELLFSGQLGFSLVSKFASFPTLGPAPLSLQFPDEEAEETFTVFDHPVIRIYRKTRALTRNDYRRLLRN